MMKSLMLCIQAKSFRIKLGLLSFVFLIMLTNLDSYAQNPDLALSQAERDSILKNYDNIFPIWGRKVIEAGVDMPIRLDKEPTDPWNMLAGANFEFNKHWQFRAEAGFIGCVQLLLNLNYRFQL